MTQTVNRVLSLHTMPLGIQELAGTLDAKQAEVVAWCESKGWRDEPVSFGSAMALLNSEVAEVVEAWRVWGFRDATAPAITYDGQPPPDWKPQKPEGVASEFADILIRLLDDGGLFEVSLEREAHRQVGNFGFSSSFLENMNTLHVLIARASEAYALEDAYQLQFGAILMFLFQCCTEYGVDLEYEYQRKMAYNHKRPYRHGNKRA